MSFSLRCVALGEPLADAWLADPRAKIVCCVRHGEAAHQVRAEEMKARGIVCRCDEPGGDRTQCPYLDPALIDAPLTERGRAQAHATVLPRRVSLVLTAPTLRTLGTAAIVAGGAPIVAVEALRSRVSAHTHTRRLTASELGARFPRVDFSGVPEADTLWTGESESRAVLDARLEGFLRALMARPERELAIVTHFTILLTLFSLPGEGFVVGTNPGRDRALFDTSQSAQAEALRGPVGVSEVRTIVVAATL